MIRKAKVPDVPELQKLINFFAERDEMLPRSLNTMYESIRDFVVMEIDGRIVGCCALHVTWGDLAEIKSLAVDQHFQGKGLGRELVQTCLNDARDMGIPKVFALTYVPGFFEALGFQHTDKGTLPHKIWSECINCHKFPNCGEEAVAIDL
ncbi:MAG: N-acetyltransferase [Armatimonadota bacterium]|nr:N-acetyltransferase [bacterium]